MSFSRFYAQYKHGTFASFIFVHLKNVKKFLLKMIDDFFHHELSRTFCKKYTFSHNKKIQFDTIFMYFNSPYSAVANRTETKLPNAIKKYIFYSLLLTFFI